MDRLITQRSLQETTKMYQFANDQDQVTQPFNLDKFIDEQYDSLEAGQGE